MLALEAESKRMRRRKRAVIKLRLSCRRKPCLCGVDNLTRVLSTLSCAMRAKFKSFVALNRQFQTTAKKLKLIFVRGKRVGRNSGLRFNEVVAQVDVPLITDKREIGFVNFWHEPSRRSLEMKVTGACSSLDIRKLTSVKAVILKAYRFIPIHLHPWKTCLEGKHIEAALQKMNEYNLPYDPYLPVTQVQRQILFGLPVLLNPNKRTPNDEFKAPSVQNSKKLRQTKIEEFFKPRRLL